MYPFLTYFYLFFLLPISFIFLVARFVRIFCVRILIRCIYLPVCWSVQVITKCIFYRFNVGEVKVSGVGVVAGCQPFQGDEARDLGP